ncbi:low-co2 inducible protein lcib [Scytonema sp. NUACC21]
MVQNYQVREQETILQELNGYNPSVFPAFHQTVQHHFPGTLPLESYMSKTYECLNSYGFTNENTMGMVAICRDEITDPLFDAIIRYWGKTFNCCSLAGFVTMGKTGLAAATDHTPIFEGRRRFTFYAMPHIAISRYGEIGKVYRQGLDKPSHACGALEAIVKEIELGCLSLETDMQDIEQSIVRQKILSTLQYGEKPDLVGITKLACQIISKDIEKLLRTLNSSVFNYAVMTGIQIHGPLETQWVYPQNFYVVGPEGKKAIDLS